MFQLSIQFSSFIESDAPPKVILQGSLHESTTVNASLKTCASKGHEDLTVGQQLGKGKHMHSF